VVPARLDEHRTGIGPSVDHAAADSGVPDVRENHWAGVLWGEPRVHSIEAIAGEQVHEVTISRSHDVGSDVDCNDSRQIRRHQSAVIEPDGRPSKP
ncbi:MAG TPA: hypothetical protein VIU11_23290, partial [Nakamurella sp.]